MPSNPGIYLFLNEKSEVIYVGKAKNLKKRVSSYFINKKDLGEKTRLLVGKIQKIGVIKARSEIEALLLEASSIKKFNPVYNSKLTDGKAYPLIRITIKDNYPKVLISRRQDDEKSIYFGPYPNSGAMKMVLKIIRRIFPFQAVLNHPKRICLYYHLGLCPCPPVFDS
ncbi:MAG: GIY-YIG nuclease family protein, partial [Patescibacteria group bacterium]